MEITIRKNIERQMLVDVFVTAIEGGSNYWYIINDDVIDKVREVVSYQQRPSISVAILDAVLDYSIDVDIHDVENPSDVLGTISASTIKDRIQKLADDSAYNYALDGLMSEEYDANSADVIFQYIVLGGVEFA